LDLADAAAHRPPVAPARHGVAADLPVLARNCSLKAAPNVAHRNPRGYRCGCLWIEFRTIENVTVSCGTQAA